MTMTRTMTYEEQALEAFVRRARRSPRSVAECFGAAKLLSRAPFSHESVAFHLAKQLGLSTRGCTAVARLSERRRHRPKFSGALTWRDKRAAMEKTLLRWFRLGKGRWHVWFQGLYIEDVLSRAVSNRSAEQVRELISSCRGEHDPIYIARDDYEVPAEHDGGGYGVRIG